ncbi:hypothetical protein DH2020_035727 [Rehmannia glutinosa]|uniref:Flavin-containing monooxygenase n=1 Tax=Rehmannia glutinosa TaxID=99300 RepID=A0ABR0V7E3_REHGL
MVSEQEAFFSGRCILVNGPVIVGAGPSGLAVAAGLKQQGVPFNTPLSTSSDYLESYAKRFEIEPRFDETVKSAKYDESCGLWRVKTVAGDDSATEYICRWLVVASGENAEKVVPEFKGGKRVLVVGCGNSGMEVSLDLCHHRAVPLMVVRSSVHVLPREILGKSTFELAVSMMKWMPLWVVDKILLAAARLILGSIEKYGLKRPSMGPLQLKNTEGKTPVLDIGTLSRIKSGDIKIVPGIKKFLQEGVELINGEILEIDSVILATGYSSNVPSWLKESEFFSRDGIPKSPFPNGWKGKDGLYAVGFTRRGLSGASMDAIKVAQDIGKIWNQETKQKSHSVGVACNRRCKP